MDLGHVHSLACTMGAKGTVWLEWLERRKLKPTTTIKEVFHQRICLKERETPAGGHRTYTAAVIVGRSFENTQAVEKYSSLKTVAGEDWVRTSWRTQNLFEPQTPWRCSPAQRRVSTTSQSTHKKKMDRTREWEETPLDNRSWQQRTALPSHHLH